MPCLVFLAATGSVLAQDDNIGGIRELNLQDCIQLALENNLDLQIERYNVRVANYNLSGAYSAFDPTFGSSWQSSESIREGSFNQDLGVQNADSEFESDRFSAGVSGMVPLGLTYDITGNLSHDQNIFGGNAFSPGGQNEQYSGDLGVNLSQPLLRNFWIDSPRATIRINKRRVRQSGLGLRLAIMNTVASVERAYYDLIAAEENVRVQETALQLAEKLLAENRRRVEVGAMAKLDESEAKSQVQSRIADLLDSRNALEMQENVLKGLITDDFKSWYNVQIHPAENLVVIPQELELQESWDKALQLRPDLLQLKIDMEIEKINTSLAFNQLFPELNIIGGYGRFGIDGASGPPGQIGGFFDDIRDGNNPRHYYGAVLNFPLGNINARNRYRASLAVQKQSALQVKRFEQQIIVEVDNLVRLAQTSLERVQARRAARVFAEEALRAEEKKFAEGISTPFVILDLQNQLTAARFQEVRSLADYNKTLADLSLSEGVILNRNQIALDFE